MKKVCRTSLVTILIVSMLLIANITGTFAASTIKFTDVKSTSWYYTYVNKLIDLKITSGIGDNKFGPNNNLTRAEFVTFLCKATGLTQKIGYDFNDTEKHWAREWITAAVTANIIDKGTSFEPNKAITRQESVEMLCRALSLKADTDMQTPYADISTNPGYSNTAYKEYLMLGTLSDDKRYFKPTNSITRAETAAVIVNVYDYKTDPDKFKAGKIAEAEKEKAAQEEAARLAAWKESVKNIPVSVLNNTDGLYKTSVYESYKYLKTGTDYFKVWGSQYGMNEDEFANEMVRVGSKFMNTWYNADYSKIDQLKTNLKSVLESNVINNYLQENLDYVKNNKFVAQGNFSTSSGMLVFSSWGNPILRGTIKYRYLNPTSSKVIESEKIGATGNHIEIGVWYEKDVEITFLPEKEGLKATSMHTISYIRISR